MKIKKILLFLLLVFINGCNGDYSKELGKDYILERTNACCIFIYKKDVNPTKIGKSIYYDNRIIKPMIKRLYINQEHIVGYKANNNCCYLSKFEKEHDTPNGYFIIYKNNGKTISGLDKKELIEYDIKLKSMKQII